MVGLIWDGEEVGVIRLSALQRIATVTGVGSSGEVGYTIVGVY